MRTLPRIETCPGIEPLAEEWDTLADETGASPFRRPGWFAVWWRAFGDGELLTYGVRRDGRLVAVVPMVRRGRVLASPTNWHTPDFGLVSADRAATEALAAAILAERPSRVALGFLDRDGDGFGCFETAAGSCGYRASVRTLARSPFVVLRGDWESYEKSLRKHLRDNRRRRLRRLAEVGSVTFDEHIPPGRLEALLTEGMEIEPSGWKREQGTAVVSRPETLAFYRDVARWAHERGWLRPHFLRVDGRPVAFKLTVVAEGTAWDTKGGYDPEFRRFGPGVLIYFEILESLFRDGLSTYELGGADEPFKLEFTDRARERVLFQAFSHSARGTAAWAAQSYARPLGKRAAALVRR